MTGRGGVLAMRRASFPLYLHITLLAVALVAVTGLVLRHFGDAIPGIGEFGLLLGTVAVVALVASRRIAAPLAELAKQADAVRRCKKALQRVAKTAPFWKR